VRGRIARRIRDATRVFSDQCGRPDRDCRSTKPPARRFGLLDLALLGRATHKLSRIVAKDRITGILRAPFVCYIRQCRRGRGRGGATRPWIPAWNRSFSFVPVLHGALVRHGACGRFRFRAACDTIFLRDFGKRNRLGLSPPRLRQNEGRVIIESHAFQKTIVTPLRPAIAQTHRCASRDRVHPRASRFASRLHCRQRRHLQNATPH
jgi:Protein of unknown function (DUF1360)